MIEWVNETLKVTYTVNVPKLSMAVGPEAVSRLTGETREHICSTREHIFPFDVSDLLNIKDIIRICVV